MKPLKYFRKSKALGFSRTLEFNCLAIHSDKWVKVILRSFTEFGMPVNSEEESEVGFL